MDAEAAEAMLIGADHEQDSPGAQFGLGSNTTKVIGADGGSDNLSPADAIKRQVYRDARELTALSREMAALKNYYENELLQEYAAEGFDQQKVEDLVQEYTNARIKELVLKPKFAKALKSPNGHIY